MLFTISILCGFTWVFKCRENKCMQPIPLFIMTIATKYTIWNWHVNIKTWWISNSVFYCSFIFFVSLCYMYMKYHDFSWITNLQNVKLSIMNQKLFLEKVHEFQTINVKILCLLVNSEPLKKAKFTESVIHWELYSQF